MKNYRTSSRKSEKKNSKPFVHPLAVVSPKAKIGSGTKVWAFAQVREDAVIGKNCVIANGAYIDNKVHIGSGVIVQDKALVYKNVVVEDDVFIGPGACFTNDPFPRASKIRNLSGIQWRVGKGASIGANACILSEVNIGKFAMVGADSLVTKDVPDYGLAHGSPARLIGYVTPNGMPLRLLWESKNARHYIDPNSTFSLTIKKNDVNLYKRLNAESHVDPLPSIQRASDWLLRSGIQNRSSNNRLNGGVASWYDRDTTTYPYLYSEISGYAITGMLFLNRLFPNELYVQRARLAANWLINHSLDRHGGFKTRLYLSKKNFHRDYDFQNGRMYTFDTAVIAYSILQLYRLTNETQYLDVVKKSLSFLSNHAAKGDGTYWPFLDPKGMKCKEDPSKWSNQSGSYHSKLAFLYTDYQALTGDGSYEGLNLALAERVLRFQKPDGRFVTTRSDESSYFHPFCYTLEGLICAGIHLSRRDYIDAVMRAWKCIAKGMIGGSLPTLYKKRKLFHYPRSDVYSQTLRISAILYALRPCEMSWYESEMASLKKRLMAFQLRNLKKQESGGFLYGVGPDGLPKNHVNTWCTLLAIQALWMHEEFVHLKKPIAIEHFI